MTRRLGVPADSDRYCTPPEILERVYRVLGPVDLDPFGDPNSRVLARAAWDVRQGDDAFVRPWCGRTIFANPPWSRVKECARPCVDASIRHGASVVFVGPASPGSTYWERWIWPYATVCFPCPRIAFLGPGGEPIKGAERDHAIAIFGPREAHEKFARVFRDRGPLARGAR